jgi:hypothetical protein
MWQHYAMTSWRDSVSIESQDEMDGLLNVALAAAQKSLSEHGEFYPFAVHLTAEGDQVLMMAADQGLGENPQSSDVLIAIRDGLEEQRATLRAAAIVADVKRGSSDAVRVQIEHRDGAAIAVFLPYQRKRMSRGVTYGELSAMADERRIWPEQGV